MISSDSIVVIKHVDMLCVFIFSVIILSNMMMQTSEKKIARDAEHIEDHIGYIQKLWNAKRKSAYLLVSEKRCSISVHDYKQDVKLKQFWKSTGLCPPDPHQDASTFFLSKDFLHSLAHIGSLPTNSITHIRMHWILDLVKMRVKSDLTTTYDFNYLDKLIQSLFVYNLRPGFELMGNPSKIFSDFENKTQLYLWKNLITAISQHYIDLYGIKYVSEWIFESWNEPDHHDFDGLNFTIKGFLNYYDACSEGLKSVSTQLKFGGPGGSCHPPGTGNSPFCWALLEHCLSGRNYFTSESGVRLDFISFHKKGNGSSEKILMEEIETLKYIKKTFIGLSNLPFFNDEADPLKNWSLPKWWRADVTYAAFVAKVIINHINFFSLPKSQSDGFQLGLISNDNGFLSYYPNQFTQRTLLARFQINNTEPHHVQFIKKPVYSVMGLLRNLGPILMKIKMQCIDEQGDMANNDLNTVAAYCNADRKCISILISHSEDIQHRTGLTHIKLNLTVQNFNVSNVMWALYHINNIETNPYSIWKMMGSPAYPTVSELHMIKSYEEPFLQDIGHLATSLPWELYFKVLKPGVSFLNICAKGQPPTIVQKVQVLEISKTSVQIIWKDFKNRCITTYNVEYSLSLNGSFTKLNYGFVSFPSYWHACYETNFNCTVQGYYRIQAQDYWGNKGPFTKPVKFFFF